MNTFQQLVQESLSKAGFYYYHPTDFNISHSNAHIFTLRKDADYICGDSDSGKIFWIEAKETSDKKFHPMHSRSNARQFVRACELDLEFASFYYIIWFKHINEVYCFRASLIVDSRVFDPLEYEGLKVTYLLEETKNLFGKVATSRFLDLRFLREFLAEDVET